MALEPIALTSGGTTQDPYAGFNGIYKSYIVTGTATLAGNVSFNSSTAILGASYQIRWQADITLSTFSVTIEGFSINQSDVNQNGTFTCYYDGSSWSVQYFADGIEQPQMYYGVNNVTAATSGTTTWVAGVDKFYQRIVGAPTTLVGNLVYTASTVGVKGGTQFYVDLAGGITLGANSLTVFGISISTNDALSGGGAVIATFDEGSSAWRAIYIRGTFSLSNLANITALSVVANATNAAAQPTAVEADTNGHIFMRRGDTLVFRALEQDNFADSTELFAPIVLAVTINSAAVLTSHTTPVVIADASTTPGSGYPVFLGALFYMSSGGSAYSTHTNFGIRYTGSGDDLASFTAGLAVSGTSDYSYQLFPVAPSSGAAAIGDQIEFYTKSGDPTAGTRSVNLLLFLTNRVAP
jgi:hypothetical protein